MKRSTTRTGRRRRVASASHGGLPGHPSLRRREIVRTPDRRARGLHGCFADMASRSGRPLHFHPTRWERRLRVGRAPWPPRPRSLRRHGIKSNIAAPGFDRGLLRNLPPTHGRGRRFSHAGVTRQYPAHVVASGSDASCSLSRDGFRRASAKGLGAEAHRSAFGGRTPACFHGRHAKRRGMQNLSHCELSRVASRPRSYGIDEKTQAPRYGFRCAFERPVTEEGCCTAVCRPNGS